MLEENKEKALADVTQTSLNITEKANSVSNVQVQPFIINGMSNSLIEQKLNSINYSIHNNELCAFKLKQNNVTGNVEKEYIEISNILPIIIEQITYKNGKDEDVVYSIEGILTDTNEILPNIIISSEELNRASYIYNPKWKRRGILKPIPYVEKIIKYVVDTVSNDQMQTSEVYTHTGFRRINNKLIFLYHGGVVGDIEDVNVDLSQDGLEQYHFTNNEFDLKEALKTSYSILEIADPKITIPLLATIYVSPLVSLLKEVGIYADYIIWVEGKTGTRKSSLIAMILSHFGEFTRNTFPCSFRDTINNLEKKSFVLKDVPVCIDDFNPETIGLGKTAVAEKLFAMYGDRAARGRMSSNGKTLKNPYTARGMAIVTAECFPELAQSRLARAIIIDIKSNSIDLNKLRNLQDNTEILSFAMKNFIAWIIKNEDVVIPEVKDIYKKLEVETQTNTNHGRTNEAINIMYIGIYLFLKFLQENGVITSEELEEKKQLCKSTLNELGKYQNIDIESQNPVNMFKEGIEQLCATEKVQIMNYNAPENILPNRTLVGYVDNEEGKYYFLPNVLYKELVKFYDEQGVKFPLSKPALLKYLDNEGYLYRTPKSDRRTIKKRVKNATLPVIAIYKDKLGLGAEEDIDFSEIHKKQEELRNSITK